MALTHTSDVLTRFAIWKHIDRFFVNRESFQTSSHCFNLFLWLFFSSFVFVSILNKNRWWDVFSLGLNVMTWLLLFILLDVCVCVLVYMRISRTSVSRMVAYSDTIVYLNGPDKLHRMVFGVCVWVFFFRFTHYLCLGKRKSSEDLWIFLNK